MVLGQAQWTQKADFAGGNRRFAAGFSIGEKGYLGTGYNEGWTARKDFYEYDPATDTWTQIAD
jgi:N-acetylneuraminic acid mutarotase